MGTPCSTFSRARDVPLGPPPLRSDALPLGLPSLSAKDAEAVKNGNIIMRFTARIANIATSMQIMWSLENPRTSRLWLCPPIQRLIQNQNTHMIHIEFCRFGTPWRKSTSWLHFKVDLTPLAEFRCTGPRCVVTGKKHLVLSGKDSAGRWRTHIAEPYPRKLCNKIALCFVNSFARSKAKELTRLINVVA